MNSSCEVWTLIVQGVQGSPPTCPRSVGGLSRPWTRVTLLQLATRVRTKSSLLICSCSELLQAAAHPAVRDVGRLGMDCTSCLVSVLRLQSLCAELATLQP